MVNQTVSKKEAFFVGFVKFSLRFIILLICFYALLFIAYFIEGNFGLVSNFWEIQNPIQQPVSFANFIEYDKTKLISFSLGFYLFMVLNLSVLVCILFFIGAIIYFIYLYSLKLGGYPID